MRENCASHEEDFLEFSEILTWKTWKAPGISFENILRTLCVMKCQKVGGWKGWKNVAMSNPDPLLKCNEVREFQRLAHIIFEPMIIWLTFCSGEGVTYYSSLPGYFIVIFVVHQYNQQACMG